MLLTRRPVAARCLVVIANDSCFYKGWQLSGVAGFMRELRRCGGIDPALTEVLQESLDQKMKAAPSAPAAPAAPSTPRSMDLRSLRLRVRRRVKSGGKAICFIGRLRIREVSRGGLNDRSKRDSAVAGFGQHP